MQTKKKLEKGPQILCLVLALMPVIMLAFIVINIILNSRQAMTEIGFFGEGKLLSPEISGIYGANLGQYGLIPGLWGTFLLVVVAMGIAVPVSLAMAVFASEFTLGFLGKGMRTLLGILGGIPSIIYAFMAVVFAQLFIVPKFCGAGIPGDQLPLPGMYWWKPGILPFNTSTLLGGIMLSMLIIPFLGPLFDDAVKDVPHSLKEASLGLGASRWHTLWNVTLPHALSRITSACGLGALKAMGDVVIVGMVVGFESPLPMPLFDVLKSTAPLTATGAGLSGGFNAGASSGLSNSAANFAALLLLILALVITVAVYFLQRKLKKRYAQ